MAEKRILQVQTRTLRRRVGIFLTLAGLFIFVLGAEPSIFGLDKSRVIGFVQVTVFTFGLFVICLGGTIALDSLWPDGTRSIAADIGLRVAWTGYVIAFATGMADIFGLGTRPLIDTETFFGFWQARGVLIGQVIILAGFLMMIPFNPPLPPEDPKSDKSIEVVEE